MVFNVVDSPVGDKDDGERGKSGKRKNGERWLVSREIGFLGLCILKEGFNIIRSWYEINDYD